MAKNCKFCGTPLEDWMVFCDNCGKRQDGAFSNAQPPVQQQPPQRPQQPYQPAQRQPQPYRKQYQQQPYQQSITPRQPAPQGYQAPQPKKTNVGLIIGIVAGSVTLLIVLIVIAVIFLFSGILTPNTPPLPVPTQLYTVPAATKATDKPTEAETEQPTEKATEKPTEKQTEKPTEKPEPATEKPKIDTDNVGDPSVNDFSQWFLKATDSGMPYDADTIFSNSKINGEWKAIFMYSETGVNELSKVNIEAGDHAVTVTVKHKYVSVNGGDYMNDSTPDTSFDGAADNGSLTAYSNSGKLEIWFFWEYEGKQYGLGTFTNPSGEKASVGLMRP